MEGIRNALVLGLVLRAWTAIEQAPSVGPPRFVSLHALHRYNDKWNHEKLSEENQPRDQNWILKML